MRNAEVIRQWKILKTIEAGRFTSSAKLAEEHGVTERTIRRDIEALQEAGFPLYDDRHDGKKVWRLVEGYQQRLTQSFTLAELAALYFSRNMLAFLRGAPFSQDLESAFHEDPRGAAREEPAVPLAHPGPLHGAARSVEGLLEEAGRDRGAHRRDAPPAAGDDRVLLLQQQADEGLHRRPVPARLLPRRPLPVRARARVRRGAHVRRRADPEDRGARPGLRDAGRLQPVGVRALGVRDLRRQGADGRAPLLAGDGRLHPRAQLAREPGARRRARRRRAPHDGGRAGVRAQGLGQGLPAARPGRAPAEPARRDRARALRGAGSPSRPRADPGARMGHGMAALETFPNRHPGRDYTIRHISPSSRRCARRPASPTSARSPSRYVADRRCVELKSLKLYLQAYRTQGIFYEARDERDPRRPRGRARAAADRGHGRVQRARRDLLGRDGHLRGPPPGPEKRNESPHDLREPLRRGRASPGRDPRRREAPREGHQDHVRQARRGRARRGGREARDGGVASSC